MNKLLFASVISEIQQSDIFMTVKARICEAPAANLNGARVTEAFIDEVVDNENRYVGLPLYADVRSLINGNYRRLGHLYDSKTGEFHSTQIGSFYHFEKENFENQAGEKGCYLVGYARIAKRNKKLSKAISELFTDGALKFSFEVAVGEYEELDDNTILIDASESNYLEGTAIVTFPACEEAVALELVAQKKADDTEGGETEMAENQVAIEEIAEETVDTVEENPVVETAEETTEVVEETAEVNETVETAEEEAEETAEETEEAEKKKKCGEEDTSAEAVENAAVVVHEGHMEEHVVHAYDTESGVDLSQRVVVETQTSHVEPESSIVSTDEGVTIAEDDALADPATPPVVGPVADTVSSDAGDSDVVPVIAPQEHKTAEQLVAELAQVVESLKQEVEELKMAKVVAEAPVIGEVNPFVDNITSNGKYSLLEMEEKPVSYSLLSK